MKNETLLISAGTAIAAIAGIALTRLPISPDRLAGSVTVLMLLGIAALEYRVDWKKLFGR